EVTGLKVAGPKIVEWIRARISRPPNVQPSTFQPSSRPTAALGYSLIALVTIGTILWGWGFLAIYRRPLTRITATRWIYANIPEGSVIANEHWDDPLPFSIDGKMSFKPS